MRGLSLAMVLMWAVWCRADMGSIPIEKLEVTEEDQNAIILMDTTKGLETIALQTSVKASGETQAIFFMPLPATPTVSLGDSQSFARVKALADSRGLIYPRGGWFTELNGPLGGPPPKLDGVQLLEQKELGQHQVAVVAVRSPLGFYDWLEGFVNDKALMNSLDLDRATGVVRDYVKDGLCYFLVDRMRLGRAARTTAPLVITFASKEVYYPLRVNNLYDGPSDVQLMLFADATLPTKRMYRMGFDSTESTSLTAVEFTAACPDLARRFDNRPVEFQCFRMVDPRSYFADHSNEWRLNVLRTAPGVLLLMKEDAAAQWAHDVRMDVRWGKRYDPDYQLPEFPLSIHVMHAVELGMDADGLLGIGVVNEQQAARLRKFLPPVKRADTARPGRQ